MRERVNQAEARSYNIEMSIDLNIKFADFKTG